MLLNLCTPQRAGVRNYAFGQESLPQAEERRTDARSFCAEGYLLRREVQRRLYLGEERGGGLEEPHVELARNVAVEA